MKAVAFATLFLGLLLGERPVELVVGDGVERVEVLLDGESVGELREPPWRLPVDFGPELAPHELVAVARDAEGGELARARQWINLPRPQAEATVVLEEGEGGRGTVALPIWESVVRQEPRSVTASFDGRPLQVTDPRRIELPPHDPDQLHLLRVELEFSANLQAVAEVVFGGGYGHRTTTELTAVPVSLEGDDSEPTPEALAGRLLAEGRAVTPVAVEEGPAEVVVVMDRPAQASLAELAQRRTRGGRLAPSRDDFPLAEGQVLRFLWPFSRSGDHERVRYALFARSEDHPPEHGGVLWLLTAAQQPVFGRDEQRLADAVAVAGMSAASRGRRRAVLLVLGEDPADASQLDPRTVRAYLSRLGVPLVVWSAGEVPDRVEEAWGEVRPVLRESALRSAVDDLARALDRQRIVWVEGLHLPQDVTLSGEGRGLRLVR